MSTRVSLPELIWTIPLNLFVIPNLLPLSEIRENNAHHSAEQIASNQVRSGQSNPKTLLLIEYLDQPNCIRFPDAKHYLCLPGLNSKIRHTDFFR